MSGRCVELREISSRGREMATSGGEREKRQAWTHDITPPPPPPLKEQLPDVPEHPTRGTAERGQSRRRDGGARPM